MKKFIQALGLAGCVLLLTACGNLKNSDLASNSTTTTTKSKKYSTTSTSEGGYSVLLKKGVYKTSPISGLEATNYDNSVDETAMERGLIRISKKVFSTKSYVIQEGQQLDENTVTDWLGRYSKSNKTGLNPVNNGKKSSSTRNPIILQQIMEEDFYTKNASGYKLAGISLSLGLNSVDYYTNTTGGTEYSTDISLAKRRSFGQKTANTIVERLHAKKKLKNIPIMVGLFSKTDTDSLVGGTYFSYGTASANSSKITKWNSVNEKTQVLPTVDNAKAISASDESKFTSFKDEIEDYFPNVSGVTATLRYVDGKLSYESIAITTQFYGYLQVQSFAEMVKTRAQKYLSQSAPVEITISSVNDTQAVVSKETATGAYHMHVYGGN